MKLAYIGTYPPRECGIGTFTKNLVRTMTSDKNMKTRSNEGIVIAVVHLCQQQ